VTELKIHTRLKEARAFLELNQLRIATDLDIQQKTVSEIENGKLLNIPNRYIYYFHKKGISLDWIYDGSGLMTKSEYEAQDLDRTKEKNLESISKMIVEKGDLKEKTGNKRDKIGKEVREDYTDSSIKILLESKNINIQTFLSYVNSQEKMIEFLQKIVRKELNL